MGHLSQRSQFYMRNICAFTMDLMHQPKANIAQQSPTLRAASVYSSKDHLLGGDILKITNCNILASANFCEPQNQIWIQILWLDMSAFRSGPLLENRNEIVFSAWQPQGTELELPFQYKGVGPRAGVLQRTAGHPGLQFHFP